MDNDTNNILAALLLERSFKKHYHKSCLDRYQNEISVLRRGAAGIPPASFREIAKILKRRHDLDVQPSTIARFLKNRGYNFENKSKT